jgi:hypothetical protein
MVKTPDHSVSKEINKLKINRVVNFFLATMINVYAGGLFFDALAKQDVSFGFHHPFQTLAMAASIPLSFYFTNKGANQSERIGSLKANKVKK